MRFLETSEAPAQGNLPLPVAKPVKTRRIPTTRKPARKKAKPAKRKAAKSKAAKSKAPRKVRRKQKTRR